MDMLPPPNPDDAVSDEDRQAAVRWAQNALLRDQIEFEEIDDRFDAIYRAETRGELDAVFADLPTPPAPVPAPPSHPLPQTTSTLVGDIKVGGWVEVFGDLSYTSLIGDVTVDLSSAVLPDRLKISIRNLVGDTTVILPDGTRASVEGFLAIGNRKVDLSDPRPNSPIVRVRSYKLIGDTKLFSLSRLPEGLFRKLWRKLREARTS